MLLENDSGKEKGSFNKSYRNALKKFGSHENEMEVRMWVKKEENLDSIEDMNMEPDTVLRKGRGEGATAGEKEEASVVGGGSGREEMGEYIEFFQKVFGETQMETVEEVLEAFEGAEAENERLYAEIIAATEENERLEREIGGEQELLLELRELSPAELERLEKVEALEQEMGRKRGLLHAYEEKLAGISRNVMSFQVC